MLLQSRFAAFAASLVLGAGTLLATNAAFADDVDPPSRVARLSYVSGNVSFAPAGEDEWAEASLNRPLVTGDRLWADTRSRSELQIGAAVIRLDESSGFNFLNLDDQTAQVQLTQGALNLRVSRIYGDQVYEVDTPTLAFVVSRVGEYRFDVDPNGSTTVVTVFDGAGDVYGEHGSRYSIGDHQSVSFNDSELHDYQAGDLPPPNAFDQFCFDRDNRQEHSPSHEFVSEEVIGASDLDDNGDWQASPEYGHVWYPTHVSVGWAPYRDGHWAWVDPWGWTWVDAASWGFAPFHYGRWAYVSNRWGWIPGPVNVRPIYAPALVGFIGGRGWGAGIGGVAPVGWFPLGPREVFVPGYHVSSHYFNDVNVRNTRFNRDVNITNIYNNYSHGNININQSNYAYHNVPNAVTAVPGNVFSGSRPVAAANIRMDRVNLERGQIASVAGIAPNRASLVAGVAKNAPPTQAFNRQVIARSAPPAGIVPFAQRQSSLQQNADKTIAAPRYQTTAVVAGGAAGTALLHSNVRVVPQTASNAKATPITRQMPSNAAVSGQAGAHNATLPSNNQPAMHMKNDRIPQSAAVVPRNAVSPSLSDRPPVKSNAELGTPQTPRFQDRPSNAHAPRYDTSHPADNAQGKIPNNGNATVMPQNATGNHTNAGQNGNESVERANRRSNTQDNAAHDNAAHDHGAAVHNSAPVQNTYVAPNRVQQPVRELNNNPNAAVNQSVQQQQQQQQQIHVAPPAPPRNATVDPANRSRGGNEPQAERRAVEKNKDKDKDH